MPTTIGQIAQLVVPADGGGNPIWVVPDWVRNRIFFVNNTTVRTYAVELVTQSPTLSATLPEAFLTHGVDVDPLSGSLILQRELNIPVSGNATTVFRLDPLDFSVTGQFGIQTAFPSWPGSVWSCEALVCVKCGTFAGPEVGYTLIKESELSGRVGVIRNDTMQQAGFYQAVVSDPIDNRSYISRGKSGPDGGSMFLASVSSNTTTSITIWAVEIAPGAETYDTTSWPATNPYITTRVVGTIHATDVDPSWTYINCVSLGYDIQADRLMIMVQKYADGSTNTLISVDTNSASIYWKLLVGTSVTVPGFPAQYIANFVCGLLGAAQFLSVSTLNGMPTSFPFGGISFTPPYVEVSNQTSVASIEANIPGLFFVTVGNYNASAANAPVPVAGTPTTFSGYAIVGPPPKLPPNIEDLLCCDRYIMAHLYQFTSVTGDNDYFTDFDQDIIWNGITWKSGSLRFEGLQRKIGVGLAIDEQNLRIWSSPTDTLFGANFLTGVEEGLLDGAVIVRRRAIWKFVTGIVSADVGQPPLVVWTLFTGFTSAVVKGGASHIDFKVKSALLKLNVNMPRNYYQPGCLWSLFDQGCTLSKAAYGINGTVGSAGVNFVAPAGGVNPVNGPDGISYFAQGRLIFNSGVNEGLQVFIDSNNATNIYLAYPMSAVPSPGDSITYFPGCSKSFNTCSTKFNNTANFRGFDKVPPVMVSL